MNETMSVFTQSLIYSCIAFSIVFIVLGGLTLVIYAMRMLTGNSGNGSGSGSAPVKVIPAAAPAASLAPAASAPAGNMRSQHIAAITAAIMAMTRGRGRIVSVTPSGGNGPVSFFSEATRTWRTAAILQTAERRLAPSWKR